ncbi:MAG: acylneuraminate cytidylyltransferase [Peptococcaceae bacterium BICA1-8]|nr:MAG: acylneuraminate cytidylyltransferase [Peptococcaceae bacterium BICA1-8]
MRIGVIIQARMGSTRFSGKVLKEIKGKTVLQHVIKRAQQSNLIDMIVIATTTNERDSAIVNEAQKLGIKVFRGSEDDVLSRYYYVAKENEVDIIIRITSDCPLIDPRVLDDVITCYLEGNYDIVSNAGPNISQRTFPRGLDAEVFSFNVLKDAFRNAKERYQREHVTPYIYESSKKVFYFKNDVDYSKYRWTLDTEEDFELIQLVYEKLYDGKHDFYLDDIIKLFKKTPELYEINAHIEQKN